MSELNPSTPEMNSVSEAGMSETPCTHDISDFCPSAVSPEKPADPATCETRELPVSSGIR